MCYMKHARTGARILPAPSSHRVGVRELRQNLSVYLERVMAGEALEVNARGRPVAVLGPLPQPSTLVERLVRAGRATPATRSPRDLAPLPRRAPSVLGARAQRALRDLRQDKV
jgi:prevent-host-death family protein